MTGTEEFNLRRIFATGEFKRVSEEALKEEYGVRVFPNQIWSCYEKKIVVGVVPLSKKHEDSYSLSCEMLDLFREFAGKGRDIYVALAVGNNKNRKFDRLCCVFPLQKMLKRLEGALRQSTPDNGEYYWLDGQGQPQYKSNLEGGVL